MKYLSNRYEHDEDIKLIDNPDLVRYAEDGNLDKIKELLYSGVNPDSKDNEGDTALLYASYYDHLDIVKELLKYHADVDIKDNYSRTALIVASFRYNLDTVKELLKYKPDTSIKNNNNKTAFDYAKGTVKAYFIIQVITK